MEGKQVAKPRGVKILIGSVNTLYCILLVGGFNQFEKYESKWVHLPQIGVNIKQYSKPCMVLISTYIYHTNYPNVGKYTIHGSYR